ncbi:hypothetical protein L366_00987 [Klebsiella variicola]|nr:hypothetical protein L366_00987 [Klebsiella variicola]
MRPYIAYFNACSPTRCHIATKDKPSQKRHRYDEYDHEENYPNFHNQSLIYPCFLYVFGITKNTSNYQSGLLKVIPLIPSLEENLIQPEHYPNQSDNQQSNEYWDNQIRHASSAC